MQVDAVLSEIGAGDIPQMLVFNKIDRIRGEVASSEGVEPSAEAGDAQSKGIPPRRDIPNEGRERVWISARDNLGLGLLQQALGERLGQRRIVGQLDLPTSAGKLRARLHALEAVRGETHDENGWRITLDIAEADAARLAAQPEGSALSRLLPADPGDPTL